MKTPKTVRALTHRLSRLEPAALRRVAGGEAASTSTSGTPAAGDDTIADSGDFSRQIQVLSWSWGASNPG
jgi:hypothetical protein